MTRRADEGVDILHIIQGSSMELSGELLDNCVVGVAASASAWMRCDGAYESETASLFASRSQDPRHTRCRLW